MQQSRQEIEKNNLGAQLLKLRNKTAIAVEQTREAVELKEGYLLEVENLENELTAKFEQLGQVISSIQNAEKRLQVTEEAILQMSSEAQNDALRRQKVIDDLNAQIKEKETKNSDLRKEISSLESIIPVIQEQVSNNREIAAQNNILIKQEKDESNAQLVEIREKVEDAIMRHDSLVTESLELEAAIEHRREEFEKKEKDLEDIANGYIKKLEELNQKEADFRVIGRRLKREYETVFPDRKLNI